MQKNPDIYLNLILTKTKKIIKMFTYQGDKLW